MAELERDGDGEEKRRSKMDRDGARSFQFEATALFHRASSFYRRRSTCKFLGSKCPGRMSRAVLSKILNLEFHWTRQ